MTQPTPIPDTSWLTFKDAFVQRYSALTDYEAFKRYSLSFLRRSIRVNTLKICVDELKARLEKNWQLTPVPWCAEGFWIKGERRDEGNLLEHALGYIYIQEAASMIPPVVLDPKPGERILDLCASPGSKASQIAMYMHNEGVLVANDYKGARLSPLGMNLQRMGVTNAALTLYFGEQFPSVEFDRILVDAPCSGTGTIRKSLKTVNIWNPYMITKLAAAQRRLLLKAFTLLKPGGTLVYSTCSLEPEENEGVVSALLDHEPTAALVPIHLPLGRSNAVTSFEKARYRPEVAHCLRLWPQDNDTEGFFVAKISKDKANNIKI